MRHTERDNMKTIGKIAALATSVSLSFALVACGGAASSSASSSASSASDSAVASSSVAATDSTASSSVDASEADSYKNEAFGLRYVLPEGWKFADTASIKETNSALANAAGGASIDMAATNADGSAVVIVAIVEPGDETTGKTAEDYLKSQVADMEKGVKESSATYTSEEAEITFNGLDRKLPANIETITQGDQTLVIAQAVAEKEGYFMDVISMGIDKDEVVKTFESFRAIAE